MCNGLLSKESASKGLEVVALLPTYDETKHPHCTPDQHTINRSILAWECMSLLLAEFTELSADEDALESFLSLGSHPLGFDGAPDKALFAAPCLWLTGK